MKIMTNNTVITNVDIHEYPQNILPINGKELTIGDLHANFMLFIYFLIAHGIIKISEADFKELVKIYETDFKTEKKQDIKNTLEKFDEIIDKIQVIRTDVLIRLIGDEICDRGKNDYYIFKLLAKLKTLKIPLEILLSNHAAVFIKSYEQKSNCNMTARLNDIPSSNEQISKQFRSAHNLGGLCKSSAINSNELLEIIDTVYLPSLKIISYSLDDNGIIIYTHAIAGIDTIEKVAAKLGIAYNDNTAIDLAKTIDDINSAFQEKYVKGCIDKYQETKIHSLLTCENEDTNPDDNPFVTLIWNRAVKDAIHDPTIVNRPASHKGYKIQFVHGHDTACTRKTIVNPPADNIDNLDSHLGKGDNANSADMKIFHSIATTPQVKNTNEKNTYPSHEGKKANNMLIAGLILGMLLGIALCFMLQPVLLPLLMVIMSKILATISLYLLGAGVGAIVGAGLGYMAKNWLFSGSDEVAEKPLSTGYGV
jgi:hypothetical protein